MAKLLLFEKGRLLNFALTFFASFFLATTGWGQIEPTTAPPNPEAYSLAGYANPTVTSDKDDYAPGETAIITGTGWKLDSTVDIHLEEEPAHDHHHGYHGIAVDANGNWKIEYPIEERHLGVKFTVVVDGVQSKFQGLAYFTDANINFTTTGPLPANTPITVVASYTNAKGQLIENEEIKFNSPGPSKNIDVIRNSTLTYTFKSVTLSNGVKYESLPENKIHNQPDNNGAHILNGNYNSSCTNPLVIKQPVNQTTTYGNTTNIIFSVETSGDISTYQWQLLTTNPEAEWSNISGATLSYYAASTPPVSMNGYQYRAVVSGCNIAVTSNAAILTVNPKQLTPAIVANDKAYDGNTSATLSSQTVSGMVNGETAVGLVVGAVSFNDKNVGTRTATASDFSLDGAAAGNYSLAAGATASDDARITAVQLTPAIVANDKAYDGNTSATLSSQTVSGMVNGETAVGLVVGAVSFNDKNVGTRTATASDLSLDGAAAGNYSLAAGATASDDAQITAVQLTPAIVANGKAYDGNTSATLSSQTVSGMVNGETAVGLVVGAVSFNDKNVGTRTATASDLSLNGTAAGNYSLAAGATASDDAQITAVQLTPAIVANDKAYDGNTSATLSSQTVSGMVNGETAVGLVVGAVSFNDKNVGTRTATASNLSLNGTAAGNYSLAAGATASDDAQITAVQLTPAIVANDKAYDGNTSATLSSQTVSGMVNGETAVGLVVGAVSFNDKNVGTRTATASDLSLNGTAAGNYSLAAGATASDDADITALGITGTFASANKVYDGNADATATDRQVLGAVSGDVVSLSGGTASFADKNVATGKTVTLSGFALAGADKDNYSLTSVAPTTADITALGITGTFASANKVYDGNADAAATDRQVLGAVSGDVVSLSGGIASFADKNVATGKTVTLSGFALAGADKDNYSLTSVAPTTADITALGITGTFASANKVYDGNADAVVLSRSLVGNISTDAVTLNGGTASFADKNVATGKTVTLSGFALAGADKDNYSLTSVAPTTADITALGITGTFASANKVYDGNADAAATDLQVLGAVSGDAVTLNGGTASFADKNVGTGKTVTLSGASLVGSDATNYILSGVATTTADITPAPITLTVVNNSKYAGQNNPDFSVTYGTFVNNESSAVLTGTIIYTPDADRSTCAGEPLVKLSGPEFDGNYRVTYNPGTLTIHPVTIDARFSNTSVAINREGGVNLTATVSSTVPGNIKGILVTFKVNGVVVGASETTESGIATFNYTALSTTAVREITTVVGNDCVKDNAYLSIYDPNGGFVTGGGWIESPATAMASGVTGRANFGFNAKYKTGRNNTTEVDGHTNFQFKAGDLHFSSSVHHAMSLVVSGAKATYTGEGTITGMVGSFEFRLIAVDGELLGSTAKDRFRIKIWTKGNPSDVVYDNERGVSESADATTDIAGGSIVIHKPKTGGTKTAEATTTVSLEKTNAELTTQPATLDILGNLAVAPNPVKTDAKVRFSLIEDAGVTVRLFDFNGREIYNLYSGNAKANEVYEVGFQRNNLMSGIYIVKLTTDRGQSYTKNVIVE